VSDQTLRMPQPAPLVFGPGDSQAAAAYYRQFGFAVLRGAVPADQLSALTAECEAAQAALVAGRLDDSYGTTELIEGDAGDKARRFANYVLRITELSPAAREISRSRAVADAVAAIHGSGCWSGDDDRFGYVYQDARPSAESSYKRIGWHSDWQSSPHLAMWPSTAVTIHIDETGPLNGFLRVVPGSHLWATPAPYENVNGAVVPPGAAPVGGYTDQDPPYPMPLRFERVPAEIGLYAERGDIFLHDCYLWHSATMATEAEARRRHVRGSWYAGVRPDHYGPGDFVKNAAR
jgi:ectoine hydroxylase-related dioxygenase (phytanoyl-CoA dioxygenase family)